MRVCKHLHIQVLSVVLIMASSGAIGAQTSMPTLPDPASIRNPSLPGERTERDPFREKTERAREQARNLDRQRRMVFEANRLLLLVAEVKESVARTGTPSPEDTKKLEEIQKLARSVKMRMAN